MKCLLCNKEFKSLVLHLYKKHHCSVSEYKTKFPSAIVSKSEITERKRMSKEILERKVKYIGKENIDYVECQFCGFRAFDIRTHLQYKHNCMTDEYKILFPGHKVRKHYDSVHKGRTKYTSDVIRKYSNYLVNKYKKLRQSKDKDYINRFIINNNYKKFHKKRSQDKIVDAKYRYSISIAVRQSNINKKIVGQKIVEIRKQNNSYVMTKEHKAKLSKSLKKYFKSLLGKQQAKDTSRFARYSLSINVGKKGSWANLLGTKKYNKWRQKIAIHAAKNNGNKSKKELLIKQFIETLNINFVHGKSLLGFQPDFCFPEQKKIIEFNGCYWHGCQYCFPGMKQEINRHFRANRTIDCYDRKIKLFTKEGYRILEIWEHELVDFEAVKLKILTFLRE